MSRAAASRSSLTDEAAYPGRRRGEGDAYGVLAGGVDLPVEDEEAVRVGEAVEWCRINALPASAVRSDQAPASADSRLRPSWRRRASMEMEQLCVIGVDGGPPSPCWFLCPVRLSSRVLHAREAAHVLRAVLICARSGTVQCVDRHHVDATARRDGGGER